MNKQSLRLRQKIKNKRIEKFLEEVASKRPTPGGGAVAAISGATAASLVEMVANLTRKENLSSVSKKAKNLRTKLLKLADADVEAFNGVIKAWKTPKRESALKRATEVPLNTAILSNEVLVLAKEVLTKGNKNAASDAKVAIYLSKAAISGAKENVKINLKYIKDRKFIAKVAKNKI